MRGRDTRWARTCSSAAAGCRGGTACPRAWRGESRRRNRCSRRSRTGICISASRMGTSMEASRDWSFELFCEERLNLAPQGRPGLRPERHQRIELLRRTRIDNFARQFLQQALRCAAAEIEDLVADCDADRGPVRMAKHAIGQVLERKIAAPDRWPTRSSFSKPSQRLQIADRLFKRTRSEADKELLSGFASIDRRSTNGNARPAPAASDAMLRDPVLRADALCLTHFCRRSVAGPRRR